MRFEDLYQNILEQTEEEQQAFFLSYYEKRKKDLTETVSVKVTTQKERTKGKKEKTVSVTEAQLKLLKSLGLV